jgi:hypothetical protein
MPRPKLSKRGQSASLSRRGVSRSQRPSEHHKVALSQLQPIVPLLLNRPLSDRSGLLELSKRKINFGVATMAGKHHGPQGTSILLHRTVIERYRTLIV